MAAQVGLVLAAMLMGPATIPFAVAKGADSSRELTFFYYYYSGGDDDDDLCVSDDCWGTVTIDTHTTPRNPTAPTSHHQPNTPHRRNKKATPASGGTILTARSMASAIGGVIGITT